MHPAQVCLLMRNHLNCSAQTPSLLPCPQKGGLFLAFPATLYPKGFSCVPLPFYFASLCTLLVSILLNVFIRYCLLSDQVIEEMLLKYPSAQSCIQT
ncbi:hypothetical protein DL93DRAFT_763557 [Clavulina sp. PMI_390]|nr:hypothetical protein DL93DRAFT_763557 [Clavulina sp. PMI_390]